MSAEAMPGGQEGVTLLEVLTTISVIAILASIALPVYTKVRERHHWRYAKQVLFAVYAGERGYQASQGVYVDPGLCDATSCDANAWRIIDMDAPATAGVPVSFDVDIAGCGPPFPCFTASATHVTSGDMLTINDSRAWAGNWTEP